MKLDRAVLIVGECPPISSPLLPPLGGIAGVRLRVLAGIGNDAEMRRLFDCVNLFDSPQPRWNSEAAHVRATTIGICCKADLVVMLGARVRSAFGAIRRSLYVAPLFGFNRPILGMSVPHPSGRCRELNNEDVRAKTSRLLRLAFLVAKGEELRDVMCTEHGSDRVFAPEIKPERRLYECGCEVLT